MIYCKQCHKQYDDGVTYCDDCHALIDPMMAKTESPQASVVGLVGILIVCVILSVYLLLLYLIYQALFWLVLGWVLASAIIKVDNKKGVTFYKVIKWFLTAATLLDLMLIGGAFYYPTL